MTTVGEVIFGTAPPKPLRHARLLSPLTPFFLPCLWIIIILATFILLNSAVCSTSPFLPAPFPPFLPSFPPSYIPEPFPEFLAVAETVTSSDRNIPTAGRTRENGSSQRLTFDPRPAASSFNNGNFVRCQTAPDVFEGSGSRQGQRS